MITDRLSFVTDLPERPESCIQGVVQALETGDPLVTQTISSLEAPSAIAVVRELFPGVNIRFTEIPEQDPRIPSRAVSIVLWRYDGVVASPSVEAPPADVSAAVAALAKHEYSLDHWSDVARSTAAHASHDARTFLAAMVHPPPAPGTETPWDWRFRVQVAAALVASRLDETAGVDSTIALADLVDGPLDWTTTAAIIALLDVARRRPERRQHIAGMLLGAGRRVMSPISFMSAAFPAVLACRDVPDLAEALYEKLDRLFDEMHR